MTVMQSLTEEDLIKIRKIRSYLQEGFRLRIDVGLSDGMPHTIRWTRYNPKMIVMGFEPHALSFKRCTELQQTLVKERDRIFLFNFALTNTNQIKKFDFFEVGGPSVKYNVGTSSLLEPKGFLAEAVERKIKVLGVKVNYFLELIQPSLIDFVKIDTQGFELEVLKGFEERIKICLAIVAECDSTLYYKGANTRNELEKYCESMNFTLVKELYSRSNKSKVSDLVFRNKKMKSIHISLPPSVSSSRKSLF